MPSETSSAKDFNEVDAKVSCISSLIFINLKCMGQGLCPSHLRKPRVQFSNIPSPSIAVIIFKSETFSIFSIGK